MIIEIDIILYRYFIVFICKYGVSWMVMMVGWTLLTRLSTAAATPRLSSSEELTLRQVRSRLRGAALSLIMARSRVSPDCGSGRRRLIGSGHEARPDCCSICDQYLLAVDTTEQCSKP